MARDLVGLREHDPQEIEFTFESDSAKDLYILQKRAMVQEQTKDSPYFDTSAQSFGPAVAVGMGVAGGAYSGRVAVNLDADRRAGWPRSPATPSCCCGPTPSRRISP